jgi:hypothetical protein
MSCERYRRDLSDRMDEALSPRRRARLERHLRACAGCRAEEARFRRLQSAAPAGRTAPLSPGHGEELLARLRRRLETERPVPAPGGRRWRVWGPVGAAAVAAALLAWFLVLRPVPRADIYLLSEPDVFSRISLQVSESPELESEWDEVLQSSLVESLAAGEEGIPSNPFEDPLLREGVSDEELRQLAASPSADRPR